MNPPLYIRMGLSHYFFISTWLRWAILLSETSLQCLTAVGVHLQAQANMGHMSHRSHRSEVSRQSHTPGCGTQPKRGGYPYWSLQLATDNTWYIYISCVYIISKHNYTWLYGWIFNIHVYIYIYALKHIYIYTYWNIYIYVYIYVHMYICIYVYMYNCIYVYMYMCLYVCMYIW